MHSKIGIHCGPGGDLTGFTEWVTKANKAGVPVAVKSVDYYGPLYEAAEIGNIYGVENNLVFRMTKASGQVSREVPNYTVDPVIDAVQLANEIIQKLPVEFNNIVWIEAVNEVRDENSPGETCWQNLNPVDYIGMWCMEAAITFNDRGYRFVGPGFNSGRPGREGKPLIDAVTHYSMPGMLEYLRYCSLFPEKAALAVHEYSWNRWLYGETFMDWYPQLFGRFEAAIAAADLAGIDRTFKIFVTEWGFDRAQAPRYPEVVPYLDERNNYLALWPQVVGDYSWTISGGWGPVQDQVRTWFEYPVDQEFTEGTGPRKTHLEFGSTLPSPTPNVNQFFSNGFGKGFRTYEGHDNIRIPLGFRFWHGTANNPPNPAAPNDPNAVFIQPEAHELHKSNIPPEEHDLFFNDSDYTLKVFKQNGSIFFDLVEFLKPGKYNISFQIFADMYFWRGYKDFGDDPESCVVYLQSGQNQPSQALRPVPGEKTLLVFPDVVVDESRTLHIFVRGSWAFDNNGVFLFDFMAKPTEVQGQTFEERAWLASVTEQDENGLHFNPAAALQSAIFSDGRSIVHDEFGFEGYQIQAGESVDGSLPRRLYFWKAGEPVFWIEDPFQNPPPTPPDDDIHLKPFKSWPTAYMAVNQAFGANPQIYGQWNLPGHEGIDIRATAGSDVMAVDSGIVSRAHTNPDDNNYGMHIKIDHMDGRETTYAHLQELFVVVGAAVNGGDIIGKAGTTGNSTGAHLHFNLKVLGRTYTDKSGNVWPKNFFNPYYALGGLYNPLNRTYKIGYVYHPSLTFGSDGQAVNFSSTLNMREGPDVGTALIAAAPSGTIFDVLGEITGNYIKVGGPVLPTTGGSEIDMASYFFPPDQDTIGDIVILENNWGQGDERQQLQRNQFRSYVTKNSNYEERHVLNDSIYLTIDTSMADDRYYTISGTPWMPRKWKVGDIHNRTETVSVFRKADCSPFAPPYTVSNYLKFHKIHSNWRSDGGVDLTDVAEIHFYQSNALVEVYYYAPGLGLVAWSNNEGKKSYVTAVIPKEQQQPNKMDVPPCL